MVRLRHVGAVLLAGMLVSVGITAEADTLLDIQKRGKVIVGTQYSFPNWGFYDERRQPAGFDIDMAKEMAQAMNVQLELVETTSPNRIPYLDTRKVDLVISVFSVTPERALRVAFSRPYGVLIAVMFSKKGDGIESPKDLAGKRVAVSKGTGSAMRIKAAAPTAHFIEFETPADTFLAVRQGKADAGAEGFDGVATFVKQNPTFAIKGQPLPPNFLVSVGVRQDDYQLLRWIDTWLLNMENDGKVEGLYEKWFGIKRPPMPR
jgi:polar amino acid transport system substrate-binding protein